MFLLTFLTTLLRIGAPTRPKGLKREGGGQENLNLCESTIHQAYLAPKGLEPPSFFPYLLEGDTPSLPYIELPCYKPPPGGGFFLDVP